MAHRLPRTTIGKKLSETEIEGTMIPPADDREAVILANVATGSYTAFVRGKDGMTGIALLEVYQLGLLVPGRWRGHCFRWRGPAEARPSRLATLRFEPVVGAGDAFAERDCRFPA